MSAKSLPYCKWFDALITLMEDAPLPRFVTNPSQDILAFNQSAREFIFGEHARPRVYHTEYLNALVHPEDRPALADAVDTALRDTKPQQWNVRMVGTDGYYYAATGRIAPTQCPVPCVEHEAGCGQIALIASLDRSDPGLERGCQDV